MQVFKGIKDLKIYASEVNYMSFKLLNASVEITVRHLI